MKIMHPNPVNDWKDMKIILRTADKELNMESICAVLYTT